MLRKTVSWALCLLLPGVLLAAGPGAAIGNFNGDVSLNGRSVPTSTAIFPGDKLVTGRSGSAFITRPGFTMAVGSESSAELLTGGARVLNGTAEATLKPGIEVLYADLHIVAASDFAKVKVEARGDSWSIGAYSGNLKVSDAVTSITVPQGQVLYAKAKPHPQSGGGPPVGAVGTHGLSTAAIVGIVAGGSAAAAVGGFAAAGGFSGSSCKPTVSQTCP